MAARARPSAKRKVKVSAGGTLRVFLAGLATFAAGTTVTGQDIERAPIHYSSAEPHNAVAQLKERLATGATKLEFGPEHGYLRSLLRALDIPESSQILVFSKTSLQRERISPKTPRAIYFNDDVMVGFCLRGQVIEISAVDDAIGTTYYTLEQSREEKSVPERQTESCLLCHSSSANQGVPGHLVRSVFVDRQGLPLLASGTFRTDHTSPLAERWGGWYVTGTSGRQTHMGNMISQGPKRPEEIDNTDGVNVVDLKDRFTTSFYPTPHSDIVALMVLEHQVGMLNRLARAGMETRMALDYEKEFNKALGEPLDQESSSARSRIRSVGEAVVHYMLFRDEVHLTDRIQGTSSFETDFAARGPRDSKGRSLRDFDLKTRIFRYPCSYLIYSRAFDSLPSAVKDYVYQRLWEILKGRGTKKDDPVLAVDDREAILEILRETKPGLPDSWKKAPAASH
ncbi:hypothetical protein [Singulisphaera acidiphila]|uniref:Cytochrome c domain-containing protein n=1 Tax=Singulisphaera acidiphila (strain ATCC BAA-1392 / DSM 18658 / VKM B-2454 / MOB10) TaxID=886293 RepID=L0DN69_SINAD|nr:hypothetical protein [Singulisphaera acidiphila]AGA30697.1 hypothetical protein Sinac_6622 [Singulisphaera acidiphila DSM 18658]